MPFVNLAFDQRGLSESQIGLMNALPGILIIVVTPFISRMADLRKKRVLFLNLGFLLAGIFIGMQSFPLGFFWLLVLQLVAALFLGSTTPIMNAVTARMGRKYHIDYGNWRLWGSFSFASAAFLMGMLWEKIGIQWVFLFTAGLYLLSGFVSLFLEEPEGEKVEVKSQSGMKWLPTDIAVWLFLFSAFFANMGMNPFNQFSAIYMIRLGGTAALAGLMRTASALVEVPAMWFASKLEKRIGSLGVFLISTVVFALAWLGFSVATAPWMLIAITAFRGVGFGLATVSTIMYLDRKAKISEAASYQSLHTSLVFGLAPLIAGPLGGILAENFGLPTTFKFASYIGWVSTFCILLVFVRKWHTSREIIK